MPHEGSTDTPSSKARGAPPAPRQAELGKIRAEQAKIRENCARQRRQASGMRRAAAEVREQNSRLRESAHVTDLAAGEQGYRA
jgi:hypothetical protein